MAKRPLEGQKALVTGAASGIGEAVALALGAAGADVVVNDVARIEAAEAVASRIRAGGAQALALQGDVSREEDVQAMFRRMLEAWGTIDILVNNAGLQRDAGHLHVALARHHLEAQRRLRSERLALLEKLRALDHLAIRLLRRVAHRLDHDRVVLGESAGGDEKGDVPGPAPDVQHLMALLDP